MELNMSLQFTRGLISTAAAIVVLSASVGSYAQSTPMSNMGSHAGPAGEHSSMGMRKSMDGMSEKMGAMKMSGDADQDFAMMMRVHHQGALEMAQAQLDQGKDPVMRAMAKKIILAQKKEIAEFDRWLAKHK